MWTHRRARCRWWQWLAVVLAFSLAVAACGNDSGVEPTAPEQTPDPTEDAAQPEPTAAGEMPADDEPQPAPPNPVVVEMYAAEFLGDFIGGLIADFETEYPHITIDLQTFDSYDAVFDSYVLAEEQGNEPAILNLFEVLTQQARDTGYFKPLNEAVAGRAEIGGIPVNLDDMLDGVANYYLQDGEYYSLPWNASTALTFANMDLLVQAGVAANATDYDSIPSTYGEMEEACDAIRSNLDGVDCFWWPTSSWWLEMAMVQQGALLVDNGNGREGRATEIYLTSPQALAVSQFWVDSAASGDLASYADFGTAVGQFGSGSLAFFPLSSGGFSLFEGSAAENGFNLGAAPFVAPDGPNLGQTLGGSTIYLTDGLDPAVEEAALMFLFFMVQPPQAAELTRDQGYVPITPEADQILEDEGFYEEKPWRRALTEAFSLVEGTTPSNSGALFGSFRDYRSIYENTIARVISDGGDLVEALRNATAEINSLIEEYNLLVG